MYWWERAAEAVRRGEVERFGLVTTNSLPQTFNRRVVERHLDGEPVGRARAGGLFRATARRPRSRSRSPSRITRGWTRPTAPPCAWR